MVVLAMATPEWSDVPNSDTVRARATAPSLGRRAMDEAPENCMAEAEPMLGDTLSSTAELPAVEGLYRWMHEGPRQEIEEPPKRRIRKTTSLPKLHMQSSKSAPTLARSKSRLRAVGGSVAWLRTMPDLGEDGLEEVTRRNQVHEFVRREMDAQLAGRLSTPQFAARRDLPRSRPLPPVPHEYPAPSFGWQPPGAQERMGDAYLFHEPGERLRSNLLLLEHWRLAALRYR